MKDDTKPIDWDAERDAMRAPAYFAKVAAGNTYLTVLNRGAGPEERGRQIEAGRQRTAASKGKRSE
jgi:hypothetical protein